eukprot:NODE_4889_length_1098_cov_48.518974_g4342_i0.p1 GENE.NODE_4889_length_1098_cov_48.518974_g4342_i0~~NODE_4889_length_1098_cov_48.518974_g4342_i0.p1  ORF type:complete len:306 (-),score=61.23 NODE_4889_length_1098_cov_48.518974_g4342_i0:179-1048(-)
MRAAFCMLDPSQPEGQQKYVAKMSKNPKEEQSTYFLDVEMQALCKLFADEFNKRRPPKLVDFNDTCVIRCLERRGYPLLAVEPWMEGRFNKYSNNYGYVSYDDRNTPQAFSHFTYSHSVGKLLICDIQGVGDKYTDPQIHTRDGKGFGKGNLGYDGIMRFFKTHRCNSFCRYLNLPILSQIDGSSDQAPNGVPALPPSGGEAQPQEHLDLAYLGLSQEQYNFIVAQFKKCPKERGNKIGKEGLIFLCCNLGSSLTPEEATKLLKRLDINNEKCIDMKDFIHWWVGIEPN